MSPTPPDPRPNGAGETRRRLRRRLVRAEPARRAGSARCARAASGEPLWGGAGSLLVRVNGAGELLTFNFKPCFLFITQSYKNMLSNLSIYLVIAMFCFCLYNVIVEQNLFKKIIFSSIMQSAIIIYYIIVVWNPSLSSPFYDNGDTIGKFVDPVPQVLMLTAIVVGFATTALGLAIVVRIKRKFGTIMYNELNNEEDEKLGNN